MNEIFYYTGLFLIYAGVFFAFAGVIGIYRMPDFFTKLHPAGVIESFAVPVIILGIAILFHNLISLKLIFLVIFLMLAGVTACHALAKAAISSSLKPFTRHR